MNNTTETNCSFPIADFDQVKQKVLNWTKQFSTFCFLDNHQYRIAPHVNECLLAAGVKHIVTIRAGHALTDLQRFLNEKNDQTGQSPWLFGHLGYDLKNEIEPLVSVHPDHTGFQDMFFFEPAVLIRITDDIITVSCKNPEAVFNEIINTVITSPGPAGNIAISARFSREEYISTVNRLKQHIQRGDCYEINFCQEFFAEHTVIDPVSVYRRLSEVSPNPFSALYRVNDQWLICASPERFLVKSGNRLLSQPIKGTAERIKADKVKDEASRLSLQSSAKDRSENVMVVDLVRNDLSRVCKEGTVEVNELFGIYSFPQVHQMISTVSGRLRDHITFEQIIQASFPMGSMTGAPKRKVMELIEQYEKTRRGIFSGALGYIAGNGDFDFNVVIRSIMYNAATGYVSYQAGSGITYYSDADKEWEECLLKAAAIKKVLQPEAE